MFIPATGAMRELTPSKAHETGSLLAGCLQLTGDILVMLAQCQVTQEVMSSFDQVTDDDLAVMESATINLKKFGKDWHI